MIDVEKVVSLEVLDSLPAVFITLDFCVQLRGRSGRQGDPGSSRFFLSLEDNIFRIFGGDRIQVLLCPTIIIQMRLGNGKMLML